MRITIIGYDDIFVGNLYSKLKKLNHHINRIDLYISNIDNDLSRQGDKSRLLELRNFHDLTIEIVEFEPDIILYIPIRAKFEIGDEFREINDIIHVELIEHILETAQIVNCKVCYFDLSDKNNVLTQLSLKLVAAYSRSLIITSKLSETDYNEILGKILPL